MSALTERVPTLARLLRDMARLFRRITVSRLPRIALRVFLWLAVLVFAARTVATVVMERRLASTVREISGKYGILMPSSLMLPPVTADNNQAALFRAAGEALALNTAEERLVASVSLRQVTVEDRADDLRRVLDSNRLVLELAREASKRQASSWEIDYNKGTDAKIPDLVKVMQLERLIASRSLLALHEGSTKDAIAALEPGIGLASSLSHEPMLIVQLIRIAVDRINNGVVQEILNRGRGLDEEDLSRLRRMLSEPAAESGLKPAFLGEMKLGYKSGLDIMEGRVPAPLADFGWDIEDSPFLRWIGRPYILWEERHFLEAYAGLVEELGRPRFERRRAFTVDPKQMPEGKGIFYALAVPSLAEAVLRSDLREASRSCARTALALESYARAHGGYPDSLDLLVPADLPQVPVDPFSGRPLEYRREGDGYVVRSEGDDDKFHVELPGYDKLVIWRIAR